MKSATQRDSVWLNQDMNIGIDSGATRYHVVVLTS